MEEYERLAGGRRRPPADGPPEEGPPPPTSQRRANRTRRRSPGQRAAELAAAFHQVADRPPQLELVPVEWLGTLYLPGPPVTKKNRPQIVWPSLHRFGGVQGLFREIESRCRRGDVGGAATLAGWAHQPRDGKRAAPAAPIVIPNKEYREAAPALIAEARRQWLAGGFGTVERTPVRVTAIFYLPAGSTPDLLGLEEALADMLQEVGIFGTDYWIQDWSGSAALRDPSRPRTEVWIYRLGRPGEERRDG